MRSPSLSPKEGHLCILEPDLPEANEIPLVEEPGKGLDEAEMAVEESPGLREVGEERFRRQELQIRIDEDTGEGHGAKGPSTHYAAHQVEPPSHAQGDIEFSHSLEDEAVKPTALQRGRLMTPAEQFAREAPQ